MRLATVNCRHSLVLVAVCGLSIGAMIGEGQALAYDGKAFRVCADPNNLPFSSRTLDGLENKIAELWAHQLNLPLEYTWFPQRRGFIRNTLKAPNAMGDAYKCDVVMGIASGSDELLTTTPYYRSTYALVYARGRILDEVTSAEDFVGLRRRLRDRLKIGAFTPTPGVTWLARHGMTEQMVAFPAMSGDPEAYPGEIVEKELVEGRLDAVVIWGPIAGYFAKNASQVELAIIPLQSEPGIRFDFAISAGVRYGEGERKREIENLIRETSAEVRGILTSYNVPLLDIVPDTNSSASRDDD